MEVKCCGHGTVIVEMSHDEFFNITGNQIGDEYGNRGYSWRNVEGKKFSLEKVRDHHINVQNILSLKSDFEKRLKDLQVGISELAFPLKELTFYGGSEIKPEAKSKTK